MNLKNIMKRAWETAKNGASKFGGSTKEYLATALKMAWSSYRIEKTLDVKEATRIAYNSIDSKEIVKTVKYADFKNNAEYKNAKAVKDTYDKVTKTVTIKYTKIDIKNTISNIALATPFEFEDVEYSINFEEIPVNPTLTEVKEGLYEAIQVLVFDFQIQ